MSAFWMCKYGLLKTLERKKMQISAPEVKFSQSIQQFLASHIDVHSEPKVTTSFFNRRLSLEFEYDSSPPKFFLKINDQCFSENRRIVYSQHLLNFSLGDAFLAIVEGLI